MDIGTNLLKLFSLRFVYNKWQSIPRRRIQPNEEGGVHHPEKHSIDFWQKKYYAT
ncbi:hypothetical protein [Geobacillus subterraneus]|uniref:hypothetical protein n=1 Tax=Geobacillus subterraneus TaxID=129338 RepID=UPI00079CB476|nr:hypothetical protein [Geobacillus subterraneus]KYD26607.1 hypothetical protein B4113_0887 [Geobacillus sp. B4113_201601]